MKTSKNDLSLRNLLETRVKLWKLEEGRRAHLPEIQHLNNGTPRHNRQNGRQEIINKEFKNTSPDGYEFLGRKGH